MIKIPENKIREKYGVEYSILLKHRIYIKQKYRINIHINNQEYGLYTYRSSY